MKQYFQRLITLFLILTVFIDAFPFVVDGITYTIKTGSSNQCYVSSSSSYSGDIVIPETVTHLNKTYTVTGIGSHAFQDCTDLTSVTISSSLTYIDSFAFSGCTNLAAVNNTESITSIGNFAFENCTSLKSFNFTNNLTEIVACAFHKSGIKVATIPASVTSLDVQIFFQCDSLQEITFEDGITTIPKDICYSCRSLTTINLPSTLKILGEKSFYECKELQSIELPANLETIGAGSFDDCYKLKSITIPNTVTSIGSYAFQNCEQIQSISIPSSVNVIGSNAFNYCYIAKSNFVNNSSLDAVSNNYWGCKIVDQRTDDGICVTNGIVVEYFPGHESITIPSSVTTLGSAISMYSGGPKYVTIHSNSLTSKDYSSSSTLNNLFGKQVREYILGDEITTIGNYAFYESDSLRIVRMSPNVTSIGEGAFKSCNKLEAIEIPKSVTSLGKQAFFNTTGAIVINCNIPDYSNTSSASNYKTNSPFASSLFSDITFTSNVTSIGAYSFATAGNGTKLTLPNSITYIGTNAFLWMKVTDLHIDCDAGLSGTVPLSYVETVELGDHISSVNTQFRNCTSLTSPIYNSKIFARMPVSSTGEYTIPSGITEICPYAFSGCKELTKVNIPTSVNKIGDFAFFGCI